MDLRWHCSGFASDFDASDREELTQESSTLNDKGMEEVNSTQTVLPYVVISGGNE